jgi:hypothetical protein
MRAAVAAVVAHVLLLHSILMGAGMAPVQAALDPAFAALQTICSTGTDGTPDLPGLPDHASQHPACAPCGLGHCGVPLPSSAALPVRFALRAPAEAAVLAAIVDPARYHFAARPRGPPVPT